MDRWTAPPGASHRAGRRLTLPVLLAALALILGAIGWTVHATSGPGTSAGGSTSPAVGRVGVSTPAGPSRPTVSPAADPRPLRPTHLRIPSIDVSATVTTLGIHPDHTVEVPGDPDQVGWYRLGSLPGQPGSAVILGHVDSVHGPAVFYRLRSLVPGDQVVVRGSDGSTNRFEVTSITTYANADFPAQEVYRTTGPPGLALVTCGGRYDAAHGGYQANVVAFASLVT
jgi:hypothetical protein